MVKKSDRQPPSSPQINAYLQQALAHHQAGQFAQAKTLYQQILQIEPKHADALHLFGLLCSQCGDSPRGIQLIKKAIKQKPSALYHNNLANLLQDQGNLADAIKHYQAAIQKNSRYAEALNNLGTAFKQNKQYQEAQLSFQRALAVDSADAQTWYNSANLLALLGQMNEAIKQYHKAIDLNPNYADAYCNCGNAHKRQAELDHAFSCYKQAIEINPQHIQALNGLGNLYKDQNNIDLALDCYQQALKISPNHQDLQVNAFKPLMDSADWQDYAEHRAQLIAIYSQSKTALSPFNLCSVSNSNESRLHAARNYAQHIKQITKPLSIRRTTKEHHHKIHIGYLSADFREHAVGLVVQSLFEHHDKDKFHISAFSLIKSDDAIQQRVKAACNNFIDISTLSVRDAAQLISDQHCDILIDMAGYTTYAKPEIMALRPAPLQISYLGYLDSMGADFIDYIIADKWVIPEELKHYYDEKILYCEHSFMPACDLGAVEQHPEREIYGIGHLKTSSDDGNTLAGQHQTENETANNTAPFIYCCFNHIHKIDPTAFESWMRILSAVPNSVLWLYDNGSERAINNLKASATKQGVDPQRLVFGEHLTAGFKHSNHSQINASGQAAASPYVQRFAAADLFLDTFVYNAGATAIAAAWAGLPVLTCPGDSYLARMGASINAASGMDALICDTVADYEARAIALARGETIKQGTSRVNYATLRQQLWDNKATSMLFDTVNYVRNLESLFQKINTHSA